MFDLGPDDPAAPSWRLDPGPDGAVRIHLSGEVDRATAGSLEHLVETLDPSVRAVALDLSGVTFLDSAGLRLLVTFREAAERGGTRVEVAALAPEVLVVLRAAGLNEDLRPAVSKDFPAAAVARSVTSGPVAVAGPVVPDGRFAPGTASAAVRHARALRDLAADIRAASRQHRERASQAREQASATGVRVAPRVLPDQCVTAGGASGSTAGGPLRNTTTDTTAFP